MGVNRGVGVAMAEVMSMLYLRRSVGLLIERADAIGIEPPLLRQLGRTPGSKAANESREDSWGAKVQSGIRIVGRIVVNLWRRESSQ